MSDPEYTPSSTSDIRLEQVTEERDQAYACAILSLAISAALILSNFPENRSQINDVAKAIKVHEGLLGEAQHLRQANEEVLKQNQEALAKLRPAKN